MTEVGVAGISTLVKPSATTSTTIELAGFLDGTALETYGAARVDDGHHLA